MELWDAGVGFGDVCCDYFQTGACRHTEAAVWDHEPAEPLVPASAASDEEPF